MPRAPAIVGDGSGGLAGGNAATGMGLGAVWLPCVHTIVIKISTVE